MPVVHLRTYTLKTPSLASAYAQRYEPTMASLAKFDIITRGVFLSETNPKQVIAVVEFKDGDTAAAKIEEYIRSDYFKADLGDLSTNDFENIDSITLTELNFSPGR